MSDTPGATFDLALVVFDQQPGKLDEVHLVCRSPQWSSRVKTVGPLQREIPLAGGRFSVQVTDVAIDGTFSSASTATGSIRATTAAAKQCGVPEEGTWSVRCTLAVDVIAREPRPAADAKVAVVTSLTTDVAGNVIGFGHAGIYNVQSKAGPCPAAP